jgi:cytochrome c556
MRHEMMEDVGSAAKTIGAMLKGEAAFDAPVANAALEVWAEAAWDFGKLFPEGSDTGFDTEAAPAIWTDRAGFDEQLRQFSAATEAAVEAGPQDLEALKAATGPVFKVCKSCHETYRIED